jgi:hypothetical protein
MPKGEIVGMFTRRVCLSLMERIAAMMENKKAVMRELEEFLFYEYKSQEEK